MNKALKAMIFCGSLFVSTTPLLCMEQEDVYVEAAGSNCFIEKQSARDLLLVMGKSRAAVKAWKEALIESEAANEASLLVFKLKKAIKTSHNVVMVNQFSAMMSQMNSQLEAFRERVHKAVTKAIQISIMAETSAMRVSDDAKAVYKKSDTVRSQTMIMQALSNIDEAKERFMQSLPL